MMLKWKNCPLLLRLMQLIVTLRSVTSLFTSSDWPILARQAFTQSECDAIIGLYTSQLKRMEDTREADNVSRINRFDVEKRLLQQGDLDWILDRVSSKLPLDNGAIDNNQRTIQTIEDLKDSIDFTLLHEFQPGMFFGLHVDTKPNDKTHRTYNVNIMLSEPSSYKGGALQIGDKRLENLQKGDLYVYPASLPHAVHELEGGIRYTYVMALTVPETARSVEQQKSYWKASEQRLQSLIGTMGEQESRLHLIRAQYLEALGDRTDEEIDAAYCQSYRATKEASLYAQQFLEQGITAQQSGHPGAENYFRMALCVDPGLKNVLNKIRKNPSLFGVRQHENEL
jgi:2OG-Fe(II) oxygenase superfamily